MERLDKIFQLGLKELRSLWHDKVLVLFILWAFTGGIYAAATGTSLELNNAPIAIVDLDQSILSNRLKEAFQPPYFKTPEEISLEEVDALLDAGVYTFVLVFPSGLENDIRAGRRPEIQVNIDATRMSQAFIGSNYIQNILVREINTLVHRSEMVMDLPVNQVVHLKFNPNGESAWFGSVMEIINNITMLSIILTGAALIREREHGTIEHLLVMPLTPFEIMAAKVWASALVVLAAASFSLWAVVHTALQVPIAGSVSLFLLGALLHLFSTCSMGIFLGTIARSMPQLGLLLILTLLPLQMLSGGITPRESMPEIVQNIMLIAPTTHFVAFAQAILYRGAGIAVVWPQFLAVTVIGIAFFAGAHLRLRKSLASL
ncbi:ABC transporter permease [Hahella sp. CCB-MM4]|uniref:ABC transporter permease n=1 Tax=Hahella sp. (strain CCB-MM4) TaxID=1926491 RepID=UPI000B9B9024|nr:ABC transporter permease [Hahella sp. CCB-MM4]OZG71086.1 ABC transporter permease [Hahella sp. CCB-MM4]